MYQSPDSILRLNARSPPPGPRRVVLIGLPTPWNGVSVHNCHMFCIQRSGFGGVWLHFQELSIKSVCVFQCRCFAIGRETMRGSHGGVGGGTRSAGDPSPLGEIGHITLHSGVSFTLCAHSLLRPPLLHSDSPPLSCLRLRSNSSSLLFQDKSVVSNCRVVP